ncbi:hypothetical protein MIND_01149400 [Mycena indigotica]|uniref:DUF7923 domain-containing protein n=1 Tax=Mycena indigotica TaxID=2126181 RepID=A0A8H6VZD2_9AGAR|nr:uncharacterized protein MIND_01149400 [Mycena indigotica]KAF7293694.1 hypothetical protein MIND_01149400 [Mycena indigotica]
MTDPSGSPGRLAKDVTQLQQALPLLNLQTTPNLNLLMSNNSDSDNSESDAVALELSGLGLGYEIQNLKPQLHRNRALSERVALLTAQLREVQRRNMVERESARKREAIFVQHLCLLNQQLSAHPGLYEISLPLIFTVINGDMLLFRHLNRAFDGGVNTAASFKLTRSILTYPEHNNPEAYSSASHFMTVFYNRRQLLERLRVKAICTIQQFDQFLTGFSISHEGFSFVDVGGLELTEIKISMYINAFIRLPQTLRIFFGGRTCDLFFAAMTICASRSRRRVEKEIVDKLVMISPNPRFNTIVGVPLLVIHNVFAGPGPNMRSQSGSKGTPAASAHNTAPPNPTTAASPSSSLRKGLDGSLLQ